jgi:tetratricopeptide (TPR) repeat protein
MLTDLSATPIAETLRRLSAERRSGDLHVRSAKVTKIVFFDHGRIVFAASNLKKDRLGEALVALGRITEEDFTRVSAFMKDNKKRFGEALIQSGVMDKSELGTSVARQVRRIGVSLFALPEGAASFEERDSVIPLEYMVSLSIHRLLYEGIRTMTSRELILTGLRNLDRGVVLAAIPPFPFEGKRTAEEKEIIELAQRRVTVRRLAWASGGLSVSRLRAVYALTASGILEDAEDAEAAARPIVQMETGTFLLSAMQRQPDPSGQDAIRKEVQDELEHSARLDRETWLKVARTAPRDELIKALEEKMERYHALREAVSDDEQIKTDIEVILGRASAMLRLTRQAPPPSNPPVAARPAPPPSLAGTHPPARAAAPPRPPASAPPVPEPPPVSPEPDEAPPPWAPAASAEPPPTPPPPPSAPASPGPPAAAEAQPDVAPNSSNFAGMAQIEHLLMEGEVRMTVSDYANAVNVYTKLVQVAPRIPAYRVRLAIAMTCYPRTKKQAEREFFEAIRLDPDNADTHYQFGLYYKAMKARSRAIVEMRTALQLKPRHEAAREELEALAPKDSALASLKKLFK